MAVTGCRPHRNAQTGKLAKCPRRVGSSRCRFCGRRTGSSPLCQLRRQQQGPLSPANVWTQIPSRRPFGVWPIFMEVPHGEAVTQTEAPPRRHGPTSPHQSATAVPSLRLSATANAEWPVSRCRLTSPAPSAWSRAAASEGGGGGHVGQIGPAGPERNCTAGCQRDQHDQERVLEPGRAGVRHGRVGLVDPGVEPAGHSATQCRGQETEGQGCERLHDRPHGRPGRLGASPHP